MQIELRRVDDLIDNVKFWQTEHGFDTINIHEQGSSFWVNCSQHFARNPAFVKNSAKSFVIKPQTLASNMAKSRTFSYEPPYRSLTTAKERS
jgi:hypothetical protein